MGGWKEEQSEIPRCARNDTGRAEAACRMSKLQRLPQGAALYPDWDITTKYRGLRCILAGAKLEAGRKFMEIRKVGEKAYVSSNSE